jgi:hypothetical protein
MWIAGSLVGLVGALLCVTLVLLPVGIPVLGVARRMFGSSIRLMLPRAVAHPAKEAKRSARRRTEDVTATAKRSAKRSAKGIGNAKKAVGGRTRKRASWVPFTG